MKMWTKYLVAVLLLVGTVLCHPHGRVVNGTDSEITRHPYIASLRLFGEHSCGCTILSPTWILTAAHCVNGFSLESLTIQYGLTNVSPEGANVIPLKRYIMHEKYSPAQKFIHDIALIELKGELIYNYKTITPVALPEPYFEIEQSPKGEIGVLAGWGLNATGGVRMQTLQEVDLKIYSDEDCRAYNGDHIRADQLCAGVDQGDRGACNSDSGGPLVYKERIQVGIVSIGFQPCGTVPVVFAKVSHYIDWIHRHMYD